MIAVEGFTKLYGDVTAVSDLTFSVEPGKVMGLVGPNGAGKTTALRCISGIIPATHGRIEIGGTICAMIRSKQKSSSHFSPTSRGSSTTSPSASTSNSPGGFTNCATSRSAAASCSTPSK